MMLIKKAVFVLAILALVAAPAMASDCNQKSASAAVAKSDCSKDCSKDCCAEAAKYAELASHAESGCAKSAEELIAVAKKSGCEKTAALATKAETGDEEAMSALIAKYEAAPAKAAAYESKEGPSNAQLATWAESGCEKSTSELIARGKASGCAKTAELAANAEKGCDKSKDALIAAMKEEGSEGNTETK